MKTLILRLVLIVNALMWVTACNNVDFAPSEASQQLKNSDGIIPDGTQHESFNFDKDAEKAKVDVLFVVDNSESMLDEQAKLGSALSSFTSSLGKIDWQLGVTTTDVSSGPWGIKGSLVPFKGAGKTVLTKNTPNYAEAFAETVVRDELKNCDDNAGRPCPSSDERPLEALLNAMQKKGSSNKGFFRTGADLAVVIVSDEDEGSDGTNAINPASVITNFSGIFGSNKSLSVYGIIIRPGDTACHNNQVINAGKYGNVISLFVALTQGVTGSICDDDYGPTLASIGNRVRELSKSITLKYTPDPSTIDLSVFPEDSSLTWSIEGNTIKFNKLPAKGTKIQVSYKPLK